MRKKMVAGNWKMNYTITEAENFVSSIKSQINVEDVDVVICPNFVSLYSISNILDGTNIHLGAQNVYYEDKGAYTGEISAPMLVSAFVDYCIVGHSERRTLFNETNEIVNKKAKKLLENNIKPILCVGETLAQRETGKMFDVISKQLKESLKDISKSDIEKNVTIAYEPIWAIGTGKTASSDEASKMCHFIRKGIEAQFGSKVAENIRILYGGSVKSTNAKELLEMEDIDGALVGGASLKNDFVAIVNYN